MSSDRSRQAWLALPVILAIGAGMAWAGSRHGAEVAGWPVFALCGALAFGVNWVAFVPAWLAQTERYYDLVGSLTYGTLVVVALTASGGGARAWLLGGLVALWAARLGSFLFKRISEDGSDGRFDAIKPDFARFLMTWTLQGLWVFLTMSCALAAITARDDRPLGAIAWTGLAVWIAGFTIEAVADRQKRAFRADPENEGRFITTGLWAWSRHPNYFGEITLWTGIALIAWPALEGWQHMTLVSPVFVYLLLTRISGIPLLEARARKRWGDDPAYQAYRERTSRLLPRPPASEAPARG